MQNAWSALAGYSRHPGTMEHRKIQTWMTMARSTSTPSTECWVTCVSISAPHLAVSGETDAFFLDGTTQHRCYVHTGHYMLEDAVMEVRRVCPHSARGCATAACSMQDTIALVMHACSTWRGESLFPEAAALSCRSSRERLESSERPQSCALGVLHPS